MENTAQDEKTKGFTVRKTHTPQKHTKRYKEKRKAIPHKKYCSLIHPNELYKRRTLQLKSSYACRNPGQIKRKERILILRRKNNDEYPRDLTNE